MYFTKDGSPIQARPWHKKAIELAQKGFGATYIAEVLLGRKSQESTVRDFLTKVDLTKNAPVMDRVKVLFWDIETSPALSAHWGLYDQTISKGATVREAGILSHAWAWNGGQVYSSVLTPQEAVENDYERIVREAWSLLDNADVVVGHNCLEENHKVLTKNLDWVPIRDLNIGDELIGFDEGKSPFTKFRDPEGKWNGQGSNRYMKVCKITDHKTIQKEAFKVTLSDGSEVITTADHYWLGKTSHKGVLTWIKTEDMIRRKAHIVKYMDVWDKDNSYNSGWLSGFFDGEGSLHYSSSSGALCGMQICQRPTAAWDKCLSILKGYGLMHTKPVVREHGLGRGDCEYAYTFGKWNTLEFIGKFDVVKFKEQLRYDKLGTLTAVGRPTLTVVSVEPVGIKNIVVLGTDSSTYFSEGFAMHNCKSFDIKRMMAEFIKLGLPPPSPFKVYDTLRVAKKHFKFERNDLDSLCATLKVPYRKVKHEGLSLWMGCIQGNQDALNRMQEYNVGDIPTLRAVFQRLLPWDNQGISFALMGENLGGCPFCGESALESTGKFVYTQARKYPLYCCTNCGANVRGIRGEGGLDFTRTV